MQQTPWTKQLSADPGTFQFAVIGDRTGGNRPGIFNEAVRRLNLMHPDFVMSVGDLINGYTDDTLTLSGQRQSFDSTAGKLDMPFFRVAGNHDMTNPTMFRDWEARYGKAYYHFIYKDVLFLCAATEDSGRAQYISPDQIAYFQDVLKQNTDVRWTNIFFHKPLWDYVPTGNKEPEGWSAFEELLNTRQHTIFAGHWHVYKRYLHNGNRYMRMGTTGGHSMGNSVKKGQYDHIMWVTMKNDGPVIANLMLDGIYDEDTEGDYHWRRHLAAALKDSLIKLPVLTPQSLAFETTGAPIRFKNPDTETGVSLTLAFKHHMQVTVEPATIALTLAPGADTTITVALKTNTTVMLGDLAPVEMDWTVQYTSETGTEFSYTGENTMVIVKPRAIAKRTAPVVLDGKLDEWGDLTYLVPDTNRHGTVTRHEYWKRLEDGHCRFTTACDDSFFYIAADVTDDTLYRDTTKKAWVQDGMTVYLNAADEPIRSYAKKPTDFWFTAQRAGVTGGPVRNVTDHIPPGLRYAGITTEKGYTLEIAVPFSWLDKVQGKPWTGLRLNMSMYDYDVVDDRNIYNQLWWRGNWSYPPYEHGSGTFLRP